MAGGSFGGSSSSSSGSSTTDVKLTPEQQETLRAQTNFLTGQYLPALGGVLSGGKDALSQSQGQLNPALQNAQGVQGLNQNLLQSAGVQSLFGGLSGLSNLFSKGYEDEQVKAATQPYQEEATQQNAALAQRYGSAGALGSARSALASQNLQSLNAARQGNVAAGVRSGIAGQRQNIGQFLSQFGAGALGQAGQAAQQQLGNASAPLDLYSKYANIIYGAPQQSVVPNFAGTQGSSTHGSQHSSSFGGGLKFGF